MGSKRGITTERLLQQAHGRLRGTQSKGCSSDNPILKHYMSWPADTLFISKVALILFP